MESMRIRAKFIGRNGSLGYETDKIYDLELRHNTIVAPWPCPYASVEAFLRNWLPLRLENDNG